MQNEIIKMPSKAKTKSGHSIKKLPPVYPVVGKMQTEFRKLYVETLRENFLLKLSNKLNHK